MSKGKKERKKLARKRSPRINAAREKACEEGRVVENPADLKPEE